jgi:hypothetical protein
MLKSINRDGKAIQDKYRSYAVACEPPYAIRAHLAHLAYELIPTAKVLIIELVTYCGNTCVFCPSRNEMDNKCLLYDYIPGGNQIDLEIL